MTYFFQLVGCSFLFVFTISKINLLKSQGKKERRGKIFKCISLVLQIRFIEHFTLECPLAGRCLLRGNIFERNSF